MTSKNNTDLTQTFEPDQEAQLQLQHVDGDEEFYDPEDRPSVRLFGGALPIPDSIPIDHLGDFLSGKIDDLPKPRRPFGNSTSAAMNAIDFVDEELEYMFMLKNPSDDVLIGASTALIYALSELNEEDATFFGLLGGAVARFIQCIPELAHMVDTSEMDRHATLKPPKRD